MTQVKAFDIMSFFHVFSVLAAAQRYGNIKSIEINLLPGLNGAYCLPETKFSFKGAQVHIRQNDYKNKNGYDNMKCALKFLIYIGLGIWKKSPKIILMHHSYLKPTIFFSSSIRDCADLWTVSFEEGVGTYGDLRHHLDIARIEGKKLPIFSYYLKKFLSFFLRDKFSVLSNCEATDAQAFKNAVSAIAALTTAKDGLPKSIKTTNEDVLRNKKILFFGSPYVDRQGVSKESYKSYIQKIIENNKDVTFVAKPHPLEKKSLQIYDELGASLIDNSISGEIAISILKPDMVIGFYSGVLLVARNVYGVPFKVIDPNIFLSERHPRTYISRSIMRLYEAG